MCGAALWQLRRERRTTLKLGPHTLTVTATDGNANATHVLNLIVENTPEAPGLATERPTTLTALEGQAVNWNAASWFTDPDANVPASSHAFNYSALLDNASLPGWADAARFNGGSGDCRGRDG